MTQKPTKKDIEWYYIVCSAIKQIQNNIKDNIRRLSVT